MTRFRLYSTALSANGRKVQAYARHVGLALEFIETNVYAGDGQHPEYRSINPSGQIPALVDGDVTLTESNAILQYLDERYAESRFSGASVAERASVAQWLFWEASQWQPALTGALAAHVGHRLLPTRWPAPESTIDWKVAPLAHLERHLEGRSFLVRDELTLADFSVAGMTTYFAAVGFPFERHPHVTGWVRRMEGLGAWADTLDPLWRT